MVNLDSQNNTLLEIRGLSAGIEDPVVVKGGENTGAAILRAWGVINTRYMVTNGGQMLLSGGYSECQTAPALQVESGNLTMPGIQWKWAGSALPSSAPNVITGPDCPRRCWAILLLTTGPPPRGMAPGHNFLRPRISPVISAIPDHGW